MLRFKLKQLIAEKEFKDGQRITYEEIAQATGIHRTTLSKIANQKGYNTTSDVLNKLMDFFDCEPNELFERANN